MTSRRRRAIRPFALVAALAVSGLVAVGVAASSSPDDPELTGSEPAAALAVDVDDPSPAEPLVTIDPGPPGDATPPEITDTIARVEGDPGGYRVVLTWEPATDDTEVVGYLAQLGREVIARLDAEQTSWTYELPTDQDGDARRAVRDLRIRAVDGAGNVTPWSSSGAPVFEDPDPPTAPTGLTADVDGSTVRLSWTPGIDAVQLNGALVHRDGRFLRWVAEGTTYIDRDVPPGEHRYEVRTQDYPALNNSEPAGVLVVVVG